MISKFPQMSWSNVVDIIHYETRKVQQQVLLQEEIKLAENSRYVVQVQEDEEIFELALLVRTTRPCLV